MPFHPFKKWREREHERPIVHPDVQPAVQHPDVKTRLFITFLKWIIKKLGG